MEQLSLFQPENKILDSDKLKNFRFIDLFAGIGGIRLAFESVGGKCVFSSEIDKAACDTYELNFGERPAGDITKINAEDIPDFDRITNCGNKSFNPLEEKNTGALLVID